MSTSDEPPLAEPERRQRCWNLKVETHYFAWEESTSSVQVRAVFCSLDCEIAASPDGLTHQERLRQELRRFIHPTAA